jgi:hypothetical protein
MKTPMSDKKKELLKYLRKIWEKGLGDKYIILRAKQILGEQTKSFKKLSDFSEEDLQRVIDALQIYPLTKKGVLDLIGRKLNELRSEQKWYEVQVLEDFYDKINFRT